MKLNNKGMSLVELLASIILISIVLVFLFQLLIDLKNETDNNNFAYNNQVNRTEAIYTIQKDLLNPGYRLLAVKDVSSNGDIKIEFEYTPIESNTAGSIQARLAVEKVSENNDLLGQITKYYLKYTSVEGVKYSWEMKGAEIYPCGLFSYYINESANRYYFKVNIYLYNSVYHERNNKNRNNAVDDIELSVTGNLDDIVFSSLTDRESGYKKIGACTN